MVLSKSFGYALRGVLYVALMDQENRKVQLDEIAEKLSIPRYFLAKVMKNVVKEGILKSTKGPYGGFSTNNGTLSVPLIRLIRITEGLEQFNNCVLGLRKCNPSKPCPLHTQVDQMRETMLAIFSQTTIAGLVNLDKKELVRSIAAV